MDSEFLIGGIGIVPIIVGIVQVVKNAGLPTRFAPVLALILGVTLYVIWSSIAGVETQQWFLNILTGILAGLASSGAYSGVKAAKE